MDSFLASTSVKILAENRKTQQNRNPVWLKMEPLEPWLGQAGDYYKKMDLTIKRNISSTILWKKWNKDCFSKHFMVDKNEIAIKTPHCY